MLAFVPIALLIFAALLIQVVGRVQRMAGRTWLIAAVISVLAWGSMILIGLVKPGAVTIAVWMPDPFRFTQLEFQFSNQTWVFGFVLMTLLVAIVFYEAKFLEYTNYINKISASMLVVAFGQLAILSHSFLMFALSWTIIDLVEAAILVAVVRQPQNHQSAVTSVLFRSLGTLFLIVLMASDTALDSGLAGSDMILSSSTLLFLTAFLRIGIIPIYLPYGDVSGIQRGFVTIMRFVPLLSAFSFITLYSDLGLSVTVSPFLRFLLLTGLIYTAVKWFVARDEIAGRRYWILGMALLGLIAFIDQKTPALVGIATLMVAGGAGMFLYFPRFKRALPFIPILLTGLLAIPYTPTASLSLLFEGVSFGSVILALGVSLFIAGVIKHAFIFPEAESFIEPWMRMFHAVALYLVALSPWITIIASGNFGNYQATWWAIAAVIVLTACLVVLSRIFKRRKLKNLYPSEKVENIASRIRTSLSGVFRLNWLTWLGERLIDAIGKIIQMIVRVLEGDGGILWSFLFVVLIISLLLVPQVPR